MTDSDRKVYPVDGDGVLTIAEIRGVDAGEVSVASASDLQVGTSEDPMVVSPKLLADEIDRRIAAALAK